MKAPLIYSNGINSSDALGVTRQAVYRWGPLTERAIVQEIWHDLRRLCWVAKNQLTIFQTWWQRRRRTNRRIGVGKLGAGQLQHDAKWLQGTRRMGVGAVEMGNWGGGRDCNRNGVGDVHIGASRQWAEGNKQTQRQKVATMQVMWHEDQAGEESKEKVSQGG